VFVSNIAEIMKRKRVTVRELASLSGLSLDTINRARRNRGISECRLSTLGRIADALGVPINKLFARNAYRGGVPSRKG